MLKTRIGDQIWLVAQPDHAAVSGYLMAHWGNDEFARPGHFTNSPYNERWRNETVLAIAEHDNGWWEWEADPAIDPADGLPLHLMSLSQEDGFERWRRGVPRFREKHPWVALLISFHAYWLYAYRCETKLDPAFAHPLFGDPGSWPESSARETECARVFVSEQHRVQQELIERLRGEPAWTGATAPNTLHPCVRLLQLGDALSLALCFGGDKELNAPDIPRKSWDDRISLRLSPGKDRKIICQPYPFDQDPLPVWLTARILAAPTGKQAAFHGWWQGVPREQVRFEYASA